MKIILHPGLTPVEIVKLSQVKSNFISDIRIHSDKKIQSQ